MTEQESIELSLNFMSERQQKPKTRDETNKLKNASCINQHDCK